MTKLLPILVSLGFKAENTAFFIIISIVGIALFAVLYHFQKLTNKDISHIKDNCIADLKEGQKELKKDFKDGQKELKEDFKDGQKELKKDLKEGQKELKSDFNSRLDKIELKIDALKT